MRRWYSNIPPPLIMLFAIIVVVTVLTYVLPAGLYARTEINGSLRVVPDSYAEVPSTPVGPFAMFRAFPEGYRLATPVIFICLASALMFSVLERSRTIENAVGRLVYRMGRQRSELLLVLLTFVYGMLGVLVGYENNIATVPIAVVVVLALGGDLILAAGVSLGGMTVAFGLSPINPYTVGIGHEIAGLPLFSGWWLRSILCFGALALTAFYNVRYYRRLQANPESGIGRGLDTTGLALSQPLADYRISGRNWWLLSVFLAGLGVVLFGVFQWGFGINEISAVFLIVMVVCALTSGLSAKELTDAAMRAVAEMAPATFIIGMAATVKVILEQGQIQDTMSYGLAQALDGLPTYASAVGMSIGQSGINLLIPSGSGQALATLPVMIPLGRALDLSPQISILAFQIGDGVTNLFNPSLGGLVAMLGVCRVPFDRWLRFILPLTGLILIWAWAGLLLAVAVGYQ
ncbi:YfcC family protein [Neolewinella litorea]|uniref:YfcC family protein n=1 Tax=Neolewinella litorea TaxID=2562452 RepID=A0A4S4NIB1_9BACT|nr:AbgT family transporter [Neolewinella litorea]THH39462.1 YfcC family protein [Neolewinella litorea]